jgi:nucleotide-binding universal stress UspA family protein
VLVATDFSPGAAHALARVAVLPLAARARIIIVTVDGARKGRRAEDARDPAARLQRATNALLGLVHQSTPGARVEPLLLRGAPHEQIAAAAATARADLIVLGRHGHRPLADLFGLGTTADRLVRITDRAVVIAADRPRGPYRRPLVALDHPSGPATRRAIRTVGRLVGAAVGWTALHVADDLSANTMRRARFPQHEISRLYRTEGARLRREIGAELARRFPTLKWKLRLEWGEPRFLVPAAAAKRRADLIVVGTRTRRTLDRRLLGTVAESVLRRAGTDVLIVPEPPRPAGGKVARW